MAVGHSLTLLRDIHTLFDSGTASGLTDRQLLEQFAARRDEAAEAAFEVLVLRHGPMVLRVCRNSLADPHDAQDAFQATFLILVRRCHSIRRLESVGAGYSVWRRGWRPGRGSMRPGGGRRNGAGL